MKMDQIAFYADNDEMEFEIKKSLGLEKASWAPDHVKARSQVYGRVSGNEVIDKFAFTETINEAFLQFNYDLGIELEIIRYTSGFHWHKLNPLFNMQSGRLGRKFISHVGIHLDNGADMPVMPMPVIQETYTISHTSHYLTEGAGKGRKYHYRIYEMTPGTYVKYIRRINP